MAKKTARKRPTEIAEHQAAMDAFDLFGDNGDIEAWTPSASRPKVDHSVAYEYTGATVTLKADMDALWGAIEALADADPTPSPWAARRV